MLSKRVTVKNETGIHCRPALKIIRVANTCDGDIFITSGDITANAKSMIGVMGLCASQGTELEVHSHDDDTEHHLNKIVSFIGGY